MYGHMAFARGRGRNLESIHSFLFGNGVPRTYNWYTKSEVLGILWRWIGLSPESRSSGPERRMENGE